MSVDAKTEHVDVYFLFGESEELAKSRVYIGQTEDLAGRLRSHHRDKEFWTTAVVIVSPARSIRSHVERP